MSHVNVSEWEGSRKYFRLMWHLCKSIEGNKMALSGNISNFTHLEHKIPKGEKIKRKT